MIEIAYSISLPDSNILTGVASKLFIKDEKTLLTISANHAPLVGTFSNGTITVYPTQGNPVDYSFEDAFLNCHDNQVSLTAL